MKPVMSSLFQEKEKKKKRDREEDGEEDENIMMWCVKRGFENKTK